MVLASAHFGVLAWRMGTSVEKGRKFVSFPSDGRPKWKPVLDFDQWKVYYIEPAGPAKMTYELKLGDGIAQGVRLMLSMESTTILRHA